MKYTINRTEENAELFEYLKKNVTLAIKCDRKSKKLNDLRKKLESNHRHFFNLLKNSDETIINSHGLTIVLEECDKDKIVVKENEPVKKDMDRFMDEMIKNIFSKK